MAYGLRNLMLKLTTCQGENTFEVTRRLAGYLSGRLGVPVACVEDVPWPERYRLIDAGEMTLGWICGLPYVVRADQPNAHIELLAAPVMQGERYGERPYYFSDVVVHKDSPFQQFADLRGASWAYNEPGSQSGYGITRYTLAIMGKVGRFFGRVIGSGGHMNSLGMILRGEVDASAIDTTVLEWALKTQPQIRAQIRIIDTLGPSPIPPLVIQKSVPPELTRQIRNLLLQMHEDVEGRTVLASGDLVRFTAVQDSDYNLIRQMNQRAQTVTFE
jgi:phosphonate transport system substrate-binding protein